MNNLNFTLPEIGKLKAYGVALIAPMAIAIIAAVIVWAFARAAVVTGPDADEATRAMLQRRCAMPVQMMTTEVHHPYTGERVTVTRAVCAMPKEPEVINHD